VFPFFKSGGKQSLSLFSHILNNFRYANRAVWFMDGYAKGLTGANAVWANWKYRGHCVLPPNILDEVKKSIPNL